MEITLQGFGKLRTYYNLILFVAPSNEHFVFYCGTNSTDAELVLDKIKRILQ